MLSRDKPLFGRPFQQHEADRLPVPLPVFMAFMASVLEAYTRTTGPRGYVPEYECRCREIDPTDGP